MGITGMGVLFLLEILTSFFRYTEFEGFQISKKKIFYLGLKGVIEKRVGCFLVYLSLGGVFLSKSVKKCVCVIKFKKRIVTYEKCIY